MYRHLINSKTLLRWTNLLNQICLQNLQFNPKKQQPLHGDFKSIVFSIRWSIYICLKVLLHATPIHKYLIQFSIHTTYIKSCSGKSIFIFIKKHQHSTYRYIVCLIWTDMDLYPLWKLSEKYIYNEKLHVKPSLM